LTIARQGIGTGIGLLKLIGDICKSLVSSHISGALIECVRSAALAVRI
jgi:hypothetical protein